AEYQFKPCYKRVLRIFWLKNCQKPEGVTSRLKSRLGAGSRLWGSGKISPLSPFKLINLILSSSLRGKSQGFSLPPTPCLTFNLLVTPSGFWQFFSQKIRKTLL
ncbi:MAG: hypothetical protein ACKPGT_36485, partial [Microcystis sp.]